jgi:hypothetical protein
MINWLAQGLLDSAGFVASCFITRDAPIRRYAGRSRDSPFGVYCGRVGVLACAVDHSAQPASEKMPKHGLAAIQGK